MILPLQVATVLTVYGIETRLFNLTLIFVFSLVATVLTVYGIETIPIHMFQFIKSKVATVLTVYGIETLGVFVKHPSNLMTVATVLTVYGIETC